MASLTPSEKDYLEAIYLLARRLDPVRCIDVANYMEHAKPSVTKAVQNLCAKGYLQKIDHGIVFTQSGRAAAENIFERHCILTHALRELGIDEPTAVRDARSMERVISDEAVNLTARVFKCQKRLTGSCPAADIL